MLSEAKTAFQTARYAEVVSLLDQIHSGPSMPEIESLRKEAISRQTELVRLIEDIKAQVASKDYAALRFNVDRVLELSPGDRRVMKLDEQLSKREKKEREREVRRLEQERLLEEQQREARRSKQLRLWSSGKQTGERRVFTLDEIEYAFRWCPPGKFTMGSPTKQAGRAGDEDQVQVELTKGFWMQETVVTQAMWSAVMGSQPWRGQTLVKEGPNCLATYVDWNSATEFCHRLTAAAQQSGALPAGEIALPTEVRWEYACRAGTTTAYSFGSEPAKLGDYAWFSDNTSIERYAHEVGQKKPNPWGLLDMHGNVWEWCQDGYDAKLRGGCDPVVSSGSSRVLRGGSWNSDAIYARCSSRYSSDPAFRNSRLGFRVLLELQDQHAAVNAASLRGLVEFGSPVAIGELRHPNAHQHVEESSREDNSPRINLIAAIHTAMSPDGDASTAAREFEAEIELYIPEDCRELGPTVAEVIQHLGQTDQHVAAAFAEYSVRRCVPKVSEQRRAREQFEKDEDSFWAPTDDRTPASPLTAKRTDEPLANDDAGCLRSIGSVVAFIAAVLLLLSGFVFTVVCCGEAIYLLSRSRRN